MCILIVSFDQAHSMILIITKLLPLQVVLYQEINQVSRYNYERSFRDHYNNSKKVQEK